MDRRKIGWKAHFWCPFLCPTPPEGRESPRKVPSSTKFDDFWKHRFTWDPVLSVTRPTETFWNSTRCYFVGQGHEKRESLAGSNESRHVGPVFGSTNVQVPHYEVVVQLRKTHVVQNLMLAMPYYCYWVRTSHTLSGPVSDSNATTSTGSSVLWLFSLLY